MITVFTYNPHEGIIQANTVKLYSEACTFVMLSVTAHNDQEPAKIPSITIAIVILVFCFLLNLNELKISINFEIYIYFLVNIQALQVWLPEGINCRLQLVSFRICWQHSFWSKNMISNLSSAVLEWSNSKNWHTLWYIAFVAIIYCYLLYYYLLYFVFYAENTNVWLYWRIAEL